MESNLTLRELTEQLIQRDAKIIEDEKTFRMIFCLSPIPMILTRVSDGKFIRVNNAFVEVSGYSEEEAIGKTATELNLYVNPEDREKR